jgi:hypothetical protein
MKDFLRDLGPWCVFMGACFIIGVFLKGCTS